jgi:hypothetical protein
MNFDSGAKRLKPSLTSVSLPEGIIRDEEGKGSEAKL